MALLDLLQQRLGSDAVQQISSRIGAATDSTLLTGEQEQLKQSAPGVMGALSRFLDQDNDGSVMDDVSGLLSKAFRR